MGVVGGRIQVGGMRRSSGGLQCTGRRQSEVVLTSSNLELTTLPTSYTSLHEPSELLH